MAGTLAPTVAQHEPDPEAGLCVLLVGDAGRAEFEGCVELLESTAALLRAPDTVAAAKLLAEQGVEPDLLVLLQAFPGQVRAADLERLRRLTPLTPIVMLLGTWCEGEMRSGRPLRGTVRVYWHQWHAGYARRLARLRAGRTCGWSLPPTAASEERVLCDAGWSLVPESRLVGVFASRFESAGWLTAACRAAGCPSVWIQPWRPVWTEGLRLVLFDGSDFRGAELEQLSELARRGPEVPVIALADLPRIEDHERILRAGAAAVLSKPLDPEDLLWTMGRFIGP